MTSTAQFVHDPDTDRYLPANKAAIAVCEKLDKLTLTTDDLTVARLRGHRTTLTNGLDIGRVDMRV